MYADELLLLLLAAISQHLVCIHPQMQQASPCESEQREQQRRQRRQRQRTITSM
jgi:hypothetical protein